MTRALPCKLCRLCPPQFCSWGCEIAWLRSRWPLVGKMTAAKPLHWTQRRLNAGERSCEICRCDLVGCGARARFCVQHSLERRVRKRPIRRRQCAVCGVEGAFSNGRTTCSTECRQENRRRRHRECAHRDPNHNAKKRARAARLRIKQRAIIRALEELDCVDEQLELRLSSEQKRLKLARERDRLTIDPYLDDRHRLSRRLRAAQPRYRRKAAKRDLRRKMKMRIIMTAARELGLIDSNVNIIEMEK